MTFKQVIRDFVDWTSIPGLTQIVYALNSATRLFWAAMWAGLFGMTVYQVYIIIDRFIKYPMEVTTELAYGVRPFVVFTVCNINPYKFNVIKSSSVYADLQKLLEDYQRMVDADYGDIENDRFGLNEAKTMYEKEQWASDAQMLIMNQLSSADVRNASFTYDEFIKSCYYNGVPCTEGDWTSFTEAQYGVCFQFNKNAGSNYTTYRAGSNFGLRLLVMAGQEDAWGNRFALPTTKTAGVRIGVSYADQYMSMVSFGTDCPLGAETMISMEMSKIERLKKPYGVCVDSVPATSNFYNGFNYTLINCLRSCIQQRIIDNCGCGDPRYARPKGINECTVDKLGCIRRFKKANAQTEGTGNFSSINDCGCKPSCHESMISVATSFAKFPSDSYRVLNGPGASQDYACGTADSVFGNDTKRCIKWYQHNSAVLNVWYDGLDYEKNTEEVSYSIGDVANDLGGQTGLWLGITVISIVETIFLLIVSCAYCICGRKEKIAPLDHEISRDPRAERIRQLRDELDEHHRKAEQLRRELLEQAEREEQQRIAQAAYERAVRAQAEAENAAAATLQPVVPP